MGLFIFPPLVVSPPNRVSSHDIPFFPEQIFARESIAIDQPDGPETKRITHDVTTGFPRIRADCGVRER